MKTRKTVTLEYIQHEDRISKKGKPWKSCKIVIKNKNGEDMWLNGFGNSVTESWSDKDEVEIDVWQEEYNGKQYWKFEAPRDAKPAARSSSGLESRVVALETKLEYVMSKLEALSGAQNSAQSDVSAKVDPVAAQKEKEAQELAQSFGGKMLKPGDDGYVNVDDIKF